MKRVAPVPKLGFICKNSLICFRKNFTVYYELAIVLRIHVESVTTFPFYWGREAENKLFTKMSAKLWL